jgi:hypothetical protein
LTARATDSGGASSVSAPASITVFGGVNLYATDPDASENPGAPNIDPPADPAVFTVRRFGETNDGIVVDYEVSGTASNGVDYVRLPGQVNIPAGASSAQIVVRPIDDVLVEGTETVVLTLVPTCPQCLFVNPPCLPPVTTNCYPIGPDNRAVAYIHDNDPVGTNFPPEVHLVTPRDGTTFVGPTNILLGADAFDRDGSVTKVEFFQGDRSLGLATGPLRTPFGMWLLTWSNVAPGHYAVTAHATDNVGATTVSAPANITVVTNSSPPPPLTNRPPAVNIVARDPFASEGMDFWMHDWDANRWAIDIWNPWHVNIGGTNTATFVVRRHGATNDPLTVSYEIGGTASNGVDYVALPGSVTVPAGKRTAQIVVTPIDDSLSEGIETVVLTVRPSPAYTVGVPLRAAAIIIDNDQPRPPCLLLSDHQFHLGQPATNGFCFRIEASTDLRQWLPICTNVVTDGALHFVDSDAPPLNVRFYRAVPEPGLPPDD